ncbi:hypothetical protein HN51_069564 [Arachis hypogaea]
MQFVFQVEKIQRLQEGRQRILVAADLVGRGIVIERVNIMINYDILDSADTYLHRIWHRGACNYFCVFNS